MTSAKLTILSAQAGEGLTLLSDVVRRPTLAAAEIERLRAETLDELRVNMEQPGTLARAAAARLIYGDGPYGHLVTGTPKSVAAVTRPQLQKLHATYFRPDHAVLIFVGQLTPAQGLAWAEEFFGDWKNPATPPPVAATAPAAPKPRVVVIDMPNAGQAAVIVGKPGIPRQDAQYFPGLVASTVLGGGYSARLNNEIRVKRGLTYGASSDLAARRQGGAFTATAQTKNSAGPEVATLMRAELDRLAAEPVPGDELTPRTSTLIGEYGRALETNDGVASKLAGWAAQGIPLDVLQSYTKDVHAVSADAVQKFAGAQLRPADTSVVIAGSANSMKATLATAFPGAEIIPQKALDLDSATLRPLAKSPKKK
jgi:zinc protease